MGSLHLPVQLGSESFVLGWCHCCLHQLFHHHWREQLREDRDRERKKEERTTKKGELNNGLNVAIVVLQAKEGKLVSNIKKRLFTKPTCWCRTTNTYTNSSSVIH